MTNTNKTEINKTEERINFRDYFIPIAIAEAKNIKYDKNEMVKGDRRFKVFYLFKNMFKEETIVSEKNIEVLSKLLSKTTTVEYFYNSILLRWENGQEKQIKAFDLFRVDEEEYTFGNLPINQPNTKHVFKYFREEDPNFVHLIVYYGWDIIAKKENVKSFILKIKRRDEDLANEILAGRLSIVMANLISVSRDLKEKNIESYKYYRIKTKTKMRDIYEPQEDLKKAFVFLNHTLQRAFDTKQKKFKTNQFAYIKNRNILMNAKVHAENKYITQTDISSYFESTKWEYIESYLKYMCKDKSLLEEVRQVVINPETQGLYMGSPISGTLTNLLMYKVCKYVQNTIKDKNIEFSIYADDVTFSSNERPVSIGYAINLMKHAFETYGLEYELKKSKTKQSSVQRRRICGVTINHENKVTSRLKEYKYMKLAFYILRNQINGTAKSKTMKPETLFGKLNFYLYIDETGKYQRLVEKYPDVVNKFRKSFMDNLMITDDDKIYDTSDIALDNEINNENEIDLSDI